MSSIDTTINLVLEAKTDGMRAALAGLGDSAKAIMNTADSLKSLADKTNDVDKKAALMKNALKQYQDGAKEAADGIKTLEDKIAELKEKMSAAQAAGDHNAFATYAKEAKTLEGDLKTLKNLQADFQDKVTSTEQEVKNLADSGGKLQSVYSGVLTFLTNGFKSLVSGGINLAFDAIGKLGGVIGKLVLPDFHEMDTILGNFTQMEGLLKDFPDAASGTIKTAGELRDRFETLGGKVGASTDHMFAAAKTLVSSNLNLDQTAGLLEGIYKYGSMMGTGQDGIGTAITQFTQALSKGKPEMQDWKSIQEQLPGINDRLAKTLNQIDPEKYKEITGANLTAQLTSKEATLGMQDLLQAFIAIGNNKSIDEQAGKITSFEKLGTAAASKIQTAWAKIFASEAGQKALADFSDMVMQVIESITDNITMADWGSMGRAFIEGFSGTTGGLNIENIRTTIDELWLSIVNEDNAKSAGQIIGNAVEATNTIITALPQIVDGFFKVLESVTGILQNLGLLKSGTVEWKDHVKETHETFAGATRSVDEVRGAMEKLGVSSAGVRDENKQFWQGAIASTQLFDNAASTMFDKFYSNTDQARTGIEKMFQQDIFQGFFSNLSQATGLTTAQLQTGFTNSFTKSKGEGKSFSDAMTSALSDLSNKSGDFAKSFQQNIETSSKAAQDKLDGINRFKFDEKKVAVNANTQPFDSEVQRILKSRYDVTVNVHANDVGGAGGGGGAGSGGKSLPVTFPDVSMAHMDRAFQAIANTAEEPVAGFPQLGGGGGGQNIYITGSQVDAKAIALELRRIGVIR